MNNKSFLLSFLILFFSVQIYAQPPRQLVQVLVTPDNPDWTYNAGEQAEFKIQVLRNNVPLDGIEVKYNIQPEQMKSIAEGSLYLEKRYGFGKSTKI
jgi:cephalosporin-C deacetylase